MTFDDYQIAANETAVYPADYKVLYPALGLAGEAGEVANKVKKSIRDGQPLNEYIADEIGDVLWYCAALATDLGFNLGQIAANNLHKLADRKERGVIQGSGDQR